MYKNRFRGFTLIELLVVIAIIGILSAVVLASLNTARNKGGDASVQANLQGIRTQAELNASGNNNSYANVCADSVVVSAMASALSAAGLTATNSVLATAQAASTQECHASATGYAVSSPLKTLSTNYWCVDSNGSSKQVTSVLAANAVACPAS
ncbi:MAG: type II secretion system protein [bacterium]